MDTSEEHLGRAVDEVLEQAWPAERRRAGRLLVRSSLGRAVAGLGAILVFSLVLRATIGLEVPWLFFAFVGFLAAVAALPDPPDRAHLKREPAPPDPPAFRYYRR